MQHSGEMINAYKVLVEEPQGDLSTDWRIVSKINIGKIGYVAVGWILLTQDRVQ
jgi:hypothetical protein